MATNIIVDDDEQTIENELTKATLAEVFEYLHYKMDKVGKPVRMGVMYQDVVFHITCDKVDKPIFPRGYEK